MKEAGEGVQLRDVEDSFRFVVTRLLCRTDARICEAWTSIMQGSIE